MYLIKMIPLPKGRKLNEYINEILTTRDREEAKDLIFRLTYPYGLTEVKRYMHLTNMDDGLSCMSMAFMRTFEKYDPNKEGASFMNYYKLTIKTEVMNDKFRNYRAKREWTELVMKAEGNFYYLDEPATNKDDVEKGSKGDAIASPYDIDDVVIANDIKDRLLALASQAVRDNIKYPKQTPAHEKVMLYYAQTCIDGDPADARRIEREIGVKAHTARRIIHKYKNQMLELWEGERNYVK